MTEKVEEINIGIIGVGRIGRLHARNLKYLIPGAKVLGVADILEESAREVASQLEIPMAEKDYRALLDNDDIDAVVEVFPEQVFLDQGNQILVCSGDEADIGFDYFGAADALELLVLDRPQQLGLHGQGHVTDLIQKERPLVGQVHFARLTLLVSAGERPRLVAEQLAFHQVLGDGRAV